MNPHAPQMQQAAVTVAPASVIRSKKEKYKSVLYGFGISEVVLGSISCLLCIVSLIMAGASGYGYRGGISFVSTGLWTGIFPIISGVLGICTKRKPTICMYNANMVMAIISAVMMSVLFSLSIVSALISGSGFAVVHSLIAITSFAAFVITIIHSAYCCAGTCCAAKPYPGQVTYSTAQQYVQLSNGQYMLVQNQPLMMHQPYPTVMMQGNTMPVTAIPTQPGLMQQGYSQPMASGMVLAPRPGPMQSTSSNQVQQVNMSPANQKELESGLQNPPAYQL